MSKAFHNAKRVNSKENITVLNLNASINNIASKYMKQNWEYKRKDIHKKSDFSISSN